jgi:type I restriction enzyme S subunit
VSLADLLKIPVVVPPVEVVARFDFFAMPMFALRELLLSENKTLSGLRDTLLPKLISGEVRLRAAGDASDELEAATAAP